MSMLGALSVSVGAQQWPSFRGPQANGVLDGTTPPLSWDVSGWTNIAWRVRVPGMAHSSPVVWGDRVFVTTAVSGSDALPALLRGYSNSGEPAPDQTPHQWRLYALDRRSGRVLWERTAHQGVPRTKRHMKSSHASATPATDGRTVVAFFGSEGLHAFDVDGTPRWKRDLGVMDSGSTHFPERQWGVASSPIIDGSRVIVQCDLQKDSFLAAFQVETGEPLWRVARDEGPSWASPTAYTDDRGRRLVVTNAGKFIRGNDLSTGDEVWRLANSSEIAVPTPVVADRALVVTSGYQPARPIFAIRTSAAGDLSLVGEATTNAHVRWSRARGGSYVPTPLVYRGLLYALSTNGVLAAYDMASGQLVYERRVAPAAYSASPVAADGRLYLTSEDGDVHVVKAGASFETLATNAIGEMVMATPALSDGLLIVRGLSRVVALGQPR